MVALKVEGTKLVTLPNMFKEVAENMIFFAIKTIKAKSIKKRWAIKDKTHMLQVL